MANFYHSFNDFIPHGIEPLTSEACAYGMRILCDLNEDGVALMSEFFGLPFVNSEPWNSRVDGKPSVASIMLPRSMFNELATFLCFRKGCVAAFTAPDGAVRGYSNKDLAFYEKTVEEVATVLNSTVRRNFANPGSSHNGRNVHQLSGRIS